MRLELLGDQAVLAYCDTEDDAARLAAQVRHAAPTWCLDVVQAYFSVAVYYDCATADPTQVADWLTQCQRVPSLDVAESRNHLVPCCYDFGLDFDRIEKHTGLGREAIIAAHANISYTVYAIGFCPGFPYLGYLPQELSGVPRLESPRLEVGQGSVGLTGRQTGIYTLARPGGWNIIGRTPLTLVDIAAGYFPLCTGDRVQFEPIKKKRFHELEGKRL